MFGSGYAGLGRVLASYSSAEYNVSLLRVYRESFLAHSATGQLDSAERDLATAIREVELQRRRVLKEQLRVSFSDLYDQLFDQMVAFQLDVRQNPETAFEYSERSKAQVLAGLVYQSLHGARAGGGAGNSPENSALRTSQVQADLAPGEVLVEYAVLKDRLVAWTIRKDQPVCFTQVATTPEQLRQLVAQLRAEIRSEGASTSSASLYDILVRPLDGALQGARKIVFAPDKSLHEVPFSALFDKVERSFLVEDYEVAVVPSARFYLFAKASKARRRLSPNPRVLVVGNPAFQRSLSPGLADLKAAGVEAAQIGELYDEPIVLKGASATKGAFREDAESAEIIQFAGHAFGNRERPLLSRLILAPSATDSGILYAYEIYAWSLPRTQLIVLSACNTSLGTISDTEGVASLARPFLAIGVPSVMATLWPIEDRKAAELMLSFHRHLRSGLDVASALRAAQVERLHAPGGGLVGGWAAFELVGY